MGSNHLDMNSKAHPNRAGLTIVLAIASVLALPSSARASCISPPPFPQAIAGAPAVFVGEVVDLSGSGRWATVEVREVWSGGELPQRVEVRGGPRRENVATSADRHFKLSREYLFLPYERDGSVFKDNACTRTTRFRPELARFRPESVDEPSPTPPPGTSPLDVDDRADFPGWLLIGVVIAAALGVAVVLARRR